MPQTLDVRCEIEFPSDAGVFTPASVLVEIENISRADAPSQVVARLVLTPGEIRGGDRIPVIIGVPADLIDQRYLYSVRVHVDLSGSGEVDRGDYITVQSYPVLTHGHGTDVRVTVRKV